jgi:hypothetical protein
MCAPKLLCIAQGKQDGNDLVSYKDVNENDNRDPEFPLHHNSYSSGGYDHDSVAPAQSQ